MQYLSPRPAQLTTTRASSTPPRPSCTTTSLYLPHSLVLGFIPDDADPEGSAVSGTTPKRRLLRRVKALRLECGDLSAVATYTQLLSPLFRPAAVGAQPARGQAQHQEQSLGPAWEMVGEETHVERYFSREFKLSDPK